MHVLSLLDARFNVAGNDRIVVLGLANVLEQAAVTNFARGDVDAAEIEHDLTEQFFLYDGVDLGLGRGADYDFLQQV